MDGIGHAKPSVTANGYGRRRSKHKKEERVPSGGVMRGQEKFPGELLFLEC